MAELRQRDRTLLFIRPVFDWILDGFLEIRTRPTRRGRDPSTNLFRDSAIGATINEIRDLGIRPATSEKPGWSACHLVAKRVGLSYEAVRSIWLRQKVAGPNTRPSTKTPYPGERKSPELFIMTGHRYRYYCVFRCQHMPQGVTSGTKNTSLSPS